MTTKERFYLVDLTGKFASYNMSTGPCLTWNKSLAYSWDDAQAAENERRIYECAFMTILTIKKSSELKLE